MPTPRERIAAERARAEAAGRRLPRRLRRPPRQAYPTGAELEYSRALRREVRDWGLELLAELDQAYPRLVARAGTRTDDVGPVGGGWAAELGRIMGALLARWGARALRLQAIAERLAVRVAEFNYLEVQRQFRSVLGVDVLGAEPWLRDELQAYGLENAKLIKSIGDQTAARVEAQVAEAVRAGASTKAIKNQVKETLGSSDKRARLIARDQVGKLNGNLTRIRQRGAGVSKYRWRTVLDRRVRNSHRTREGQVYSWDNPPPDGNPGQPVQCFPGDSKLDSAKLASVFYRRRYSGELTEIVTETGETLRGTPNHPVLTTRGWLPLQAVEVGDHVLKTGVEGLAVLEGDVNGHEISFDQAFDAIAVLAAPVGEPGHSEQFHGDGTDDEVDIVDLDGGLSDDFLSALSQQACEALLTVADVALDDALLTPASAPFEVVGRLWAAPARLVRGARKLFALVGGHGGHPETVRGAAVADLDARLEQTAPDGRAAYAMLFGEGKLAPTSQVGGDDLLGRKLLAIVRRASASADDYAPSAERLAEVVGMNPESLGDLAKEEPALESACSVVEKRLRQFTGHVYNLQTMTGWYSTRRFIVHNCRCIAEPVLDEFEDLMPPRPAPDWNAIGDQPRERRRWGPEFDAASGRERDAEDAGRR